MKENVNAVDARGDRAFVETEHHERNLEGKPDEVRREAAPSPFAIDATAALEDFSDGVVPAPDDEVVNQVDRGGEGSRRSDEPPGDVFCHQPHRQRSWRGSRTTTGAWTQITDHLERHRCGGLTRTEDSAPRHLGFQCPQQSRSAAKSSWIRARAA